MAKFLLLLALGIVVYLIVSRMRRDAGAQQVRKPPAAPRAEDMVRCAVCGVNLPRSESFTSRGTFYCSDEHRRLGAPGAGKG
jgi:uncharacterized protein